jgi:lipooligosaccharide transport system permease protein
VRAAAVSRVVEREVLVYRRLLRGLAFSTFVAPLLYLGAMGLGLGKLVDANSGHVQGLSYLEFVAPGLLVASAVQLGAGESMWPVLAGVKWMRFYDGVVSTSIEPSELYVGFVVWNTLRCAVSATAFLIVAALLGGVPSAWGILAIPAAALCVASFSAPLAGYSIKLDSDLSFPMIMRLGILPIFLFSGTFFPITQLPSGLEFLAQLSPLYHGVALARAATTGNFDFWADLWHVAFLVAVVLVSGWWGIRRFTQRLRA